MSELIGVAVAVALAATAIALALVRRERRRERLAAGLRSESPHERLESLAEVERDGVAAHAERLLDQVRTERDPAVLAELARLVRRDQWEPIGRPAQADLRAWLAEFDAQRTPPVALGGTALEELDAALGERVRRVTVTTGEERLTIIRDDLDDRGSAARKGRRR
jgi:hypothetical protein